MLLAGAPAAAFGAAAAPAAVELPDEASSHVLEAGGLRAHVSTAFPQVQAYERDGRVLAGQPDELSEFSLNGERHVAQTTFEAVDDRTARWTSALEGIDLTVVSTVTVGDEGSVTFAIEEIAGEAEPTVESIGIPGHSLVSVSSNEEGAQLARTKIDTDSTTTADEFIALTAETPADEEAVRSPYAFVTGDGLSAGVFSNATPVLAQSSGDHTDYRLSTRISADGDVRRASVGAGSWTWAPQAAEDERIARHDLPTATVVVASDADGNADGSADWQDAAILLRDAIPSPDGGDRVADRVVQRIPFNIASEATNPFHKTLDNTKRLALATDDLGQWVLLKGYTSEGHDSANTDYGDHFSERAGGLDAMNELIESGTQYNADFAVHVNATEVYPAAKTFSDRIIQGQGLGWGWMNQSYGIDQAYDLGTGGVLDRFQQLADAAPGLDTVYIDVYYSNGWLAESLASQLSDMGLEVASEWAFSFEGDSIWSHWATDRAYGVETNKGINSQIVRFLGNGERDVWNPDPLLGGVDLKDFEGWTAEDDYNEYYEGIWTDNLPTKYLQHFDLLSWTDGESATFTDGVEAKMDGDTRIVTQNGAEVIHGDTYLIPWGEAEADEPTSPVDAEKMYLFSESGAERAFELTDAFDGVTSFTQYELTDTGREKVADLTASDGRIQVTAEAGTPYVVVPSDGAVADRDVVFGEHTLVADPGFDTTTLDAWSPEGDATNGRTDKGDRVAILGEGASSISQEITGLTPGETYQFGAWVEIGPKAFRDVTIEVSGDAEASRTFSSTPAQNWVGSDTKSGSHMQRANVEFTAPESGTATVAIRAADGSAPVTIDDAQVIELKTTTEENPLPAADGIPEDALHWDFEDNAPGWGPFVRGDAGGLNDARTSYSRLHEPFTQKDWKNAHQPFDRGTLEGKAVDDVLAGTFSLKAHDENNGLVYRTTPSRVDFVEGHAYEVSFDYQASRGNIYSWVLGADDVEAGTSATLRSQPIGETLETTRFSMEFTAACGTTWVGLQKSGPADGADFVLDDFVVRDLGEVAGDPACANIEAKATDGDLNPGTSNRIETTFTNSESEDAQNVGVELDLPEGWTAEVLEEDGNLFDAVAPGESVTTVWLVTPPAEAAGASEEITARATYAREDCVAVSVEGWLQATVNDRATVPLSQITPTASSEQPGSSGEGKVEYAFDADPSTIWHTNWTPEPFPHWVAMELDEPQPVDGLGYLERTSGGPNGRLKDYAVEVSEDGESWTEVASGSFENNSSGYQVVDFEPVETRFVRLVAQNAHNGQDFAAAAELRLYGESSQADEGFAPGERPADEGCEVPGDEDGGSDESGDEDGSEVPGDEDGSEVPGDEDGGSDESGDEDGSEDAGDAGSEDTGDAGSEDAGDAGSEDGELSPTGGSPAMALVIGATLLLAAGGAVFLLRRRMA